MFQAKNEKPYWQMVYDVIVDKRVGEVVPYKVLSTAIGGDILENRSSVYKARKELLKKHKRFLVIERGEGFRVVDGMPIIYHAEDRHLSAKHQLDAAGFEASNVNTVVLSPEEKKKVQDFMLYNNNIKLAFSQTLDRIEQANQYVARTSQIGSMFTSEEVAKLKDLLNAK